MQFDCKLKFSIEKYRINVNILGEKNFIHQYYQWKKKRKEIRKRKEIKERKRKENWRKKKELDRWMRRNSVRGGWLHDGNSANVSSHRVRSRGIEDVTLEFVVDLIVVFDVVRVVVVGIFLVVTLFDDPEPLCDVLHVVDDLLLHQIKAHRQQSNSK